MSEVWIWVSENARLIVSGAVGGLLASVGWLVDRYRSRGLALSTARRDAMSGRITENGDDIRAAHDEIGSLRGRVRVLEQNDTRMQESIDQLSKTVDEVKEEQIGEQRFQTMERQVEAIYNHVLSND